MRRINVAKAKAQAKAKALFSAVLAQVETGEEIVITRRGVAIARIVAEPAPPTPNFDLRELFHFTNAQPLHRGPDGGSFMAALRRDARF